MDNGENMQHVRYAMNDDTAGFINQMKNRNTGRKTEHDLKLIKNYFASIGEIRNVDDIPSLELDPCLARFCLNVRKAVKSEYELATLKSYQCNWSRYFIQKTMKSTF
jgi:hypothetical protein